MSFTKEQLEEANRINALARQGKILVKEGTATRPFRSASQTNGSFDHICIVDGKIWVEVLPPITPWRKPEDYGPFPRFEFVEVP